MATPINLTFRENLAAAVERYPDTFTVFCERAGYDPTYVRRIIKGEKINPTLLFVECMAGALGVEPLELLGVKK